MSGPTVRAKVFMSCGQCRGTDEVEIAHRVAERLTKLGYDPYIAAEEQTLRGLKENVFGQLETSEYFVFIDLKREKLGPSADDMHRGSLFSNQELAVASYLDIDLLAFREKGVKPEDGLMGFLQANCTEFTDRHLLPNVVADRVGERQWRSDWKKELRLERCSSESSTAAMTLHGGLWVRFFHVNVHNLHPRKTAFNCYVHLEKVRDLTRNADVPVRTVTLKWEGYVLPNATIAPQSSRSFDAVCVPCASPTRAAWGTFTDSSDFVPRIDSPGEYELTYVVVAENFPVARGTFVFRLGRSSDDTHLETRAGPAGPLAQAFST
jgi:hypothetical protein